MRVREVDLGDVSLSVAESGETVGRPLLLVHGYGGAKEDFTEWLDPLAARGWHAVAPDLRGHGESGRPDAEAAYGFAVFGADLLGLADALGWSRFVLLGHSMGGMVAQLLALGHPERIEGLVLMDTTHGAVDWIDPELLAAAATVLREDGVSAYVALEEAMAADNPLASPAHVRLLRERPGYAEFCRTKSLASAAPMRLAIMAELTTQPDRLEQLRRMETATLVLVGEQDTNFLEHSERMAKAMPSARLVVVTDAGHSPQFEQPDEWWTVLTAFLDEVTT